MNIVEKNVIKILNNNSISVDNIEKINIGGANINYKFFLNNKCYIAKCYQRNYFFHLSDLLIERLSKYDNDLVIKNRKIINEPFRIEITEFHNGNHLFLYNDIQIKRLLKIIDFYTQENYNIEVNTTETIYEKFNVYYSYFQKHIDKLKKVSNDIVDKLNNVYKNLDIDASNKMCVIHGDLSNTNILWNNSNPTIIDFDECIYAEKEYELASFIIKSSFNNGKLNLDIAKNIVKNAKDIITNFNLKKLKDYIKFYILKVLYEKLYFYEITDLDIESNDQKRDYWLWWFNLLIGNQIDEIIK